MLSGYLIFPINDNGDFEFPLRMLSRDLIFPHNRKWRSRDSPYNVKWRFNSPITEKRRF
jgi:hypothetical protein